eukprot:jgi/Mesvir1/15852/Mv03399-RA.1
MVILHASPQQRVEVHIFDAVGVGGGASGVAGGLLHPFSPRGKLLWKGAEGFAAAMDLVAVAEEAVTAVAPALLPVVLRSGLVRPAHNEKAAKDFRKFSGAVSGQGVSTSLLEGPAFGELLPGAAAPPGGCALHVPQGVVLRCASYLQGIWLACCRRQAHGGNAVLHRRRVTALASLDQPGAGAIDTIAETRGRLPLTPCLGHVLSMEPPRTSQGPSMAPTTSALRCMDPSSALDGPAAVHGEGHIDSNSPSLSRDGHASSDCPALTRDGDVATNVAVVDNGNDASLSSGHALGEALEWAGPSLLGNTYLAAQGPRQVLVGATKVWGVTSLPGALPLEQHVFPLAQEGNLPVHCAGDLQRKRVAAKEFGSEDSEGALRSGRDVRPESGSGKSVDDDKFHEEHGEGLGVRTGMPFNSSVAASATATATLAMALTGGQLAPADPLERTAVEALLPKAIALHGLMARWRVDRVLCGVRAIPPRTLLGSVPLAGRLDWARMNNSRDHVTGSSGSNSEGRLETAVVNDRAGSTGNSSGSSCGNKAPTQCSAPLTDSSNEEVPKQPAWWLLGGLGSRGLVYHAWLGKAVAAAVFHDNESLLPGEVTAACRPCEGGGSWEAADD